MINAKTLTGHWAITGVNNGKIWKQTYPEMEMGQVFMSLKSGCDLSDILHTWLMPRTSNEISFLKQFGERLRQLRTARLLTQEDVAAAAGFSRSYYNEIETGKRNVSLLNLYKLAQCLEVNLSELFTLSENNELHP